MNKKIIRSFNKTIEIVSSAGLVMVGITTVFTALEWWAFALIGVAFFISYSIENKK